MALSEQDIIDGKYQIVRLLGEGGMGAVYEGLNTRIQRRVAIKVLHGEVAKNADAVTRFEREAQAAGRIGSKHIVEVLDLGDLENGDRYLVMEYLDGEDLTRRIRKLGRLAPEEAYPLLMQLLEGLGAAHEAGIVHRDLKPDNIYLLPSGERADFVKILDFGISKFNAMSTELSMTQTGVVMGTPYYMSPEQARGSRDIDARADVYAAGVILYEALSGSVPHSAETFNELILKIVLEDAPPLGPGRGEADQAFFGIVQKAMARDREQRFQSAAEFQQALTSWADHFQIKPVEGIKPGSGAYRHTRSQGTESAWDRTALGTMAGDRLPPLPPLKRNRLPLVVAAAVALVAVGGGVAFKVRADSEAEARAQAAQAVDAAEEQRRQELDEKRNEELAQQRQAAELAQKEAEEAKRQAESALGQVETQRAEAARLAAEKLAAEQERAELAARQAAARQAQQKRSTAAPSAKSTSSTKAADKQTTAKTSTGRTIRADF